MKKDLHDHRRSFNENGYFVARGLLGGAEIQNVLEDIKTVFANKLRRSKLPVRDSDDNRSLCRNMYTLLEHSKEDYIRALRLLSRLHSAYTLMMHPAIIRQIASLGMGSLSLSCGVATHVVSDQLKIPGGYSGWAPHQDWTAAQGSLNHVVIWAPLMDVDEAFYPLCVIPGSHRKGVWPCQRDKVVTRGALIEISPESLRSSNWTHLDMRRGDVAFLSGFTVHKTGTGSGDGVRIACGTRYEDITEKTYVERGYPSAFTNSASQEELHPGFPRADDIEKLFNKL